MSKSRHIAVRLTVEQARSLTTRADLDPGIAASAIEALDWQRPAAVTPTVGPDMTREMHPAYAVIGASRVSTTPGRALFGSDFLHQHYVSITIRPASVRRDISHDWIGSTGENPYIEVALSEAQWASFVASMNIGDGVPATLDFRDKPVPGILPTTNRREQLKTEVDARLAHAVELIRGIADKADASNISAKAKADIRAQTNWAAQELTMNLPWVAEVFAKHGETVIEYMKTEVNAYITATIQRAGLQALGGPLLELAEPTTEEDA